MQKLLLSIVVLIGISLGSPLFGTVPSQFNAFFFGDFTCAGSDTQGRLGAGGNINVQNYAVGCQIYNPNPQQSTCISFGSVTCTELEAEPSPPYLYSLVAGLSLSATNTEVYAGGVAYGTTEPAAPTEVLDCPNTQGSIINFSSWQTSLSSLSITLSEQATTGTVVNNYGALTFNGAGANPEIFFLDGNVLSTANGISIGTGIAPGAAIIININGTSPLFQYMGTTGFQSYAGQVVFNFYQATSVTLSGIAVFGSILAPLASFTNTNGVIWGQIFGNSWNHGSSSCAQINWVPFTPNVNFSPQLCGDGVVEAPEQCDLGASQNGLPQTCCDSNCNYVHSGTVCRPDAGICDVPEVCDGMHPTCPTDQFLPVTTPCGALFGICDVQLEQHCPGNAPYCYGAPPAPLWFWDAYNVISFNTYTCNGGDVEGRLAARNNANLNSFTLGLLTSAYDYYSFFSLLVAGNATWVSGSNHNGHIGVGGTFVAPPYLTADAINAYVTGQQFDAAQAYYETIQGLLSNVGVNAMASLIYGDGLFIQCTSANSLLYHFTVDSGTFNQVNWYLTQGCLFSAGWIIDITGTGPVTFQGGAFPGVVERVIYNVLGSGRAITGATGIAGNILAPQNSYSQNTGVTYGRVIVGDVPVARQNNKPDCHNFQNVTLTNKNLKAVNIGDGFIYVVDLGNYCIGDLVCINGECHHVTGGKTGDVDHDGKNDNMLIVDAPFTSPQAPLSAVTTTINPNLPRTVLTPTYYAPPTTIQTQKSGSNQLVISFVALLASLFFLM